MIQKCELVEITGEQLKRKLGRVWNLGSVYVSQDPGSDLISIIGTRDTFDRSMMTIQEFKQAVLSEGIENPVTLKFSVAGDKGQYIYEVFQYDDIVVCRYKSIIYSSERIELIFEMLAKGKELKIFNGNTSDGEQQGKQKHLFWASVLKGNVH